MAGAYGGMDGFLVHWQDKRVNRPSVKRLLSMVRMLRGEVDEVVVVPVMSQKAEAK
ncbi:hypothetical protein [Cryobacterium sp. TMT2-14]|uniref:hypothetical protein n=1 Tax=Cryobacterium sp. TMT2-14 TaxID=1259245 RepID=UPI00141B3E23|nr:hypothetical protein [Cryobacterium sp. TMT2-14]